MNLKAYMARRGIGPQRVADELGLSRNTVQRYLRGATPSGGAMLKIEAWSGRLVRLEDWPGVPARLGRLLRARAS